MKLTKSREQVVEILKDALKEEKFPWRTPYKNTKPRNPITGVVYKGVNNLLLTLVAIERGIDDPRWMTFNQAVKNGYIVKEGAKGVPIEFWSFYNTKTKKNMSPAEANKWIEEHEKEKEAIYAHAKTYHVFSATDLKGIEKYASSASKTDIENTLAYRVLNSYLENENIILDKNMPSYSYIQDVLYMPDITEIEEATRYLSVLAHECIHSTGATGRLNRHLQTSDKVKYAKEELIAEIGSTFLCADLDLQRTNEDMTDHKAYI